MLQTSVFFRLLATLSVILLLGLGIPYLLPAEPIWPNVPLHSAIESIGAVIPSKSAIYSAKDNGIGFDMKHSDKIFPVFQLLHRHGEYSGSAIGLAIARRIVQHHGGKLWVEAIPDKGASFYFTLPGPQLTG